MIAPNGTGLVPAMTTTEVALQDQSLDELGDVARREHGFASSEEEHAITAANSSLTHAVASGKALLEARSRCVVKGEWKAWIERNFPSEPVAYRYMHLANNPDLVAECRTVDGARRAIRARGDSLPALPAMPLRHAEAEFASDLHAEGRTYKEIAEICDVNYSRAWELVNHERKKELRRKREQRDQTKKREHAREGKRRKREEAVKRAVKKAGAATQEAYALVERLQDVLAQAQREATDPEARESLDLAGQHHRRTRDQVVRSLGVS